MRIKVTKGSNPLGLCTYILDPAKQRGHTEPIMSSNMCGRDAAVLAQEFEAVVGRPRRWAVKQTMAHYSVSLPPNEIVSRGDIARISQELLKQMGHSNCPYFVVQHHDQEDRNSVHHWHVATSTLTYDNQWVNDSFSKLRLQQIARDLEQQFGLAKCPPRSAAEQKNITTGEHRRKQRTGEILPRETLWSAIDAATQDKPTLPMFITRLKAQGVNVHLWRKGEKYSGISFGLGQSAFAGRKLGPAYSFGGLQRHKGVYYESGQHNSALTRILNQSPAECQRSLDDYAQLQHDLDELYNYYAEGTNEYQQGITTDRLVASRAIADDRTEEELIAIIRQGQQAKAIRQDQGYAEALQYCQRQVQQAHEENARKSQQRESPPLTRPRTQLER